MPGRDCSHSWCKRCSWSSGRTDRQRRRTARFGTAGSERGRSSRRTKVRMKSSITPHLGTKGDHREDWRSRRGFVIEMLANVNFVRDLELIAKRGRIAIWAIADRSSSTRGRLWRKTRPSWLSHWNATAPELAVAHSASSQECSVRVTTARSARNCRWPTLRARTRKSPEAGAYGEDVLIPDEKLY